MTLSSSQGETSGTTEISITQTIGANNILKIKASATQQTLPTFGADLSAWTTYVEGAEFETTDEYYVVVCECTADGRALNGGQVQADVSA